MEGCLSKIGSPDRTGAGFKVLHVIDSAGLYGAEVMLLNLVGEQIKMGLSPAICSIGEKGCAEKALEAEAGRRGFRVKTFRMNPGFNLKGALDILGFARQEGFGILHSHGYKGNILFGFLPRRLRRIPVVATLHGWTSAGAISRMRVYEWLDARALRHIDAVVAVNARMLANPRLKRGGLNLHVVNNGMPPAPSEVRELDKEIADFCKTGFIVGAIGRLTHEKGFKYLVEAFARVRERRKDAKLVIIGDGPEKDLLAGSAALLGLKDGLLMPGYRAGASRYLRLFDIFVLPSLTEGLPMVILEAMQNGVPIAATRVGGVPEVLEEGAAGVLMEPASASAIVEAIFALGDGAYARSLAKRAKETVNARYSSEGMAKGYREIYMGLLEAAG
ncbi:MAG: glycosyltransferase [Deltaproteobacteria bacterium]|nr:glycosyltransferase [Deltaproteobacteria bacterium]